MKKFLIIFPLFLILVALDAYLISDYLSNQNSQAQPDIQGVATSAENFMAEEQDVDQEDAPVNTISPTPIPVEIVDKRYVRIIDTEEVEIVQPTNTVAPTPTFTPTPSPTPTPIRIYVPDPIE